MVILDTTPAIGVVTRVTLCHRSIIVLIGGG